MLEMNRDRETTASSGRADITFGREPGGQTFVKRQFAAYPFHICRPHYFAGDPAGMVTLYLQSLSGGIYEHERLSLSVAAQPRTRVHLTSQASTIVHLGNIAARTRAVLEFDPKTERITNHEEADKLVQREYREHWGVPKNA